MGAQAPPADPDPRQAAWVDERNTRAFALKDVSPVDGLAVARAAFQVADSIGYARGKADALHIEGLLHLYLGNYAQSLGHLYRALDIRLEIGDSTGIGRSYNNLGLVYARERKDSLALRYFSRSLTLRRHLRDSLGMAYTLLSLGETHGRLAQLDTAMRYVEQGMTFAHLAGNDRVRALAYTIKGDLALQAGRWYEARRNHRLALAIRKVLDDRYELARNLIGLGEVARQEGAYAEAHTYLMEAIAMAQTTGGLAWQAQARDVLAQVLTHQGRHADAYLMLRLAHAVEDSLQHIQESQRLSVMELSYQLDHKQSQIDLLRQKQANFHLKLYGLLGLMAGMLLLGGLGFFYYRYRLLNRAHRQLALKQQEVEMKNEELEHFAYRLAHDLREPLRTISSYITLIGRAYSDKLDAQGQSFMAFVSEGITHMNRLVGDLHRFAQLGREGLQFEPVALNVLLPEVQQRIAQAIAESGACIQVGPLPTVEADRTSLAQVFQNLLTNAIKFAGESPPHIDISYEDGGDTHLIRVRDEGIGMGSAFQARAFMAFTREHGRARYPGSGLGLAICAKVMEAHQGRITVESSPGAGSTFWLHLPKQVPA